MSNVQSGRAFEYGIAYQVADIIKAELIKDKSIETAHIYFKQCRPREQEKIMVSAREVALFLSKHDNRMEQDRSTVILQSDMQGVKGDVRDIIIQTSQGDIGISAKNRHQAVKHSRLSEKINFSKKWTGFKSSDEYYYEVLPIFKELRTRKERRELWRDIPDKHDRIYMPVLNAFNTELQRIYDTNQQDVARNLLHYLLGKHDYYKVAKLNGKVSIQSFNINGTLKWGSKIPLPEKMTHTELRGTTTLLVTFNKGWQLSFRIHNASSLVEPSLKFDIQIVGLPLQIARHEIDYL